MNDTTAEFLVSVRDGVLHFAINRPHKANALSIDVLKGMEDALARAAADAGLCAVVISGSGDRTFSAGADLSPPPADRPDYVTQRRTQFAATLNALLDFGKPLIAAVNGAACGAGMMISLLCDNAVAADSARFSLPEINKGLPALPGIAIVKERFGSALAGDLVLSGRWMNAAEALARGVVSKVVAGAELADCAQQLALTLGRNDARAYAQDKLWLNRTMKTELAAALAASAKFHGHGR